MYHSKTSVLRLMIVFKADLLSKKILQIQGVCIRYSRNNYLSSVVAVVRSIMSPVI